MWFIMWFWFVFLHCFTQWYHIWCKHILLLFKWIYAFSFKIPTTSIALVRWPAVQNANDWTHQKYAIFISGNYHENKTRNVERYRTLAISQSSTYGIVDVITVKSCISHDESRSHFIKLIFFIVIIARISKQYRYGAPFGTVSVRIVLLLTLPFISIVFCLEGNVSILNNGNQQFWQ